MSDTQAWPDRAEVVAGLQKQLRRMANRSAAVSLVVDPDGAGLDVTASLLLGAVSRRGPVRASELAAIGRMSRPSVSRYLAWLGELGLVAVNPDPDDGRAGLVSLTPQGAETLERLAEQGRRRIREVTSDFTVAELATLVDLLGRLNDRSDGTDPAQPGATGPGRGRRR